MGPVIYKDAPCARDTSVFAKEFRKSLWKLFYKQEIIKILKRNNNGKRKEQIMIMMSGLLLCWNMDEMQKKKKKKENDILPFYESRTPYPFLAILIFIMGVSLSNFVVVSFLLTSLRKVYFLRQRLRRYPF